MWIDLRCYKKAALSLLEYRSFHVYANLSVREILRNGIAGSKSVFYILVDVANFFFLPKCISINVGKYYLLTVLLTLPLHFFSSLRPVKIMTWCGFDFPFFSNYEFI